MLIGALAAAMVARSEDSDLRDAKGNRQLREDWGRIEGRQIAARSEAAKEPWNTRGVERERERRDLEREMEGSLCYDEKADCNIERGEWKKRGFV